MVNCSSHWSDKKYIYILYLSLDFCCIFTKITIFSTTQPSSPFLVKSSIYQSFTVIRGERERERERERELTDQQVQEAICLQHVLEGFELEKHVRKSS